MVLNRFILLTGSNNGNPVYVIYDTEERISTPHRIFDKPDGEQTAVSLNKLHSIKE
jgi:riboflavin biosynthesis pyrimidine reductase